MNKLYSPVSPIILDVADVKSEETKVDNRRSEKIYTLDELDSLWNDK